MTRLLILILSLSLLIVSAYGNLHFWRHVLGSVLGSQKLLPFPTSSTNSYPNPCNDGGSS
ncbi:uncharacterized protein Dmoj_GI26192 [Drosophila mojavensis]|uniref:Uncharacterized protein n=1 Tax=Drosophila mojavensis TaxID=7230 RepID=A0A0Q9XKD5_DROMO|nr:uncharacterized protein Dmoj_GI26192 [Drosophila mojavensis]